MKSYRKELWFNLLSRRGFVNITPEVDIALRESGIREGLTLVNALHMPIKPLTAKYCYTKTRGLKHDANGMDDNYHKNNILVFVLIISLKQ